MASVILGHPYSGALYAYFAEQLGGEYSTTTNAKGHPYYKTLYGKNYEQYVDLALTFLLLYDHVWVTPSDNFMPRSAITPEDSEFLPELRLHTDWEKFHTGSQASELYSKYLQDPKLRSLFSQLGLPRISWEQVLESACHEAGISVRERVPLLCSPGRRAVIERVIEIQSPAIHPIMPSVQGVKFIESYRSITGMALAPKNLDNLMAVKTSKAVREYGASFLDCALRNDTLKSNSEMALLIRSAMETKELSSLFSGYLRWGAKFFRFIGLGDAGLTSNFLAAGTDALGNRIGWYEFSGVIDREVGKAELIRRLDQAISHEE